MKTITTIIEFAALEEEVIIKALDEYENQADGENGEELPPENPIVVEIARLIAAYADRFDYYCENFPELPDDVLGHEPTCPIEQIAFGIFTDAVFDAFQEADDE